MLKHILVDKGSEAHLSGLREAYFGQLLQGPQHLQSLQGMDDGRDHITRFVEVLTVCAMLISGSFFTPYIHYIVFCGTL